MGPIKPPIDFVLFHPFISPRFGSPNFFAHTTENHASIFDRLALNLVSLCHEKEALISSGEGSLF